MAEQPKTSQPAAEQRRRLFGRGRRGRSGRGGGRLFGRRFLVRDGGAVVQVSVDEALAAADVVDAADGRVSSVRQGETRLLLCDGADPLVTQVSVQSVVACSGDETSHESALMGQIVNSYGVHSTSAESKEHRLLWKFQNCQPETHAAR